MTDNDPKRSTDAADDTGEHEALQSAEAERSPEASRRADALPPPEAPPPPVAAADTATADERPRRGARAALLLALLALAAALAVAGWTTTRLRNVESELAHRLQAIDQRGTAFDATQKQAQDLARDLQNRLAVIEGKVAETAGLQAQVDKLYRDRADDSFEVTLVEVEAGLALAAQQLSLGASPQVVLARLQDLESRLQRENDARLMPLRSALLADIERLRVHPATDIGSLVLRINAMIGALDHLPLLAAVNEPSRASSGVVATSHGDATRGKASAGEGQKASAGEARSAQRAAGEAGSGQESPGEAPAPGTSPGEAPSGERGSGDTDTDPGAPPASATVPSESRGSESRANGEAPSTTEPGAAANGETATLRDRVTRSLRAFGEELRELFRVRRVDAPDAMLLAPEQAYFLRQNLRLKLLDARLALLMRNEEVFRSDIEQARRWIDRYFDTEQRSVQAMQAQLRQLLETKLELEPPRIDESLAAVRAARAGVR